MDIFTLLAVLVAIVTVLSAYFLFNGVPNFLSNSDTQRQSRRP